MLNKAYARKRASHAKHLQPGKDLKRCRLCQKWRHLGEFRYVTTKRRSDHCDACKGLGRET